MAKIDYGVNGQENVSLNDNGKFYARLGAVKTATGNIVPMLGSASGAAIVTVTTSTTETITNNSVTTSATGANFVAGPTVTCNSVTVFNNTGTTLEIRRGSSGVAIPLGTGLWYRFDGVTNANGLEIRRVDQSNTQVTAQLEIRS